MKPVVNKALAVGVLVAAAGAAFLIAFTFFKKGGYSAKDSYVAHAYFADATGLTWKSRVQIAGIQVGEVDKIALVGARARLDVRIKKEVELHADACLTKVFPSALLPDALLEVTPGSPGTPRLADLPEEQREITCVREATSVQKLLDALSGIAADVQVVTRQLANTISSNQGSLQEIIQNLASVTRQVDATLQENADKLSAIVDNVQGFTGDLREIADRDKDRIHVIARNVEQLTQQLKSLSASAQSILEGSAAPAGGGTTGGPGAAGGPAAGATTPGGPGGAAPSGALAGGAQPPTGPGAGALASAPPETQAQARGVRQAIDRMNTSLQRLDVILAKVEEGKSPAGRLLVDERLGRDIGSAVEGVSNYVDNLVKLKVEMNLRSEWLLNQAGAKAYFGARLIPRPDKYYLLEVVSDPRGVDTVTTETVTTSDPASPAPPRTTLTTRTLHESRVTFTAEMAKRYGPVTFRVGIIESSGGVGADLHLLEDALQVSLSVYQFSRPYQDVFPRAKVWVNYSFLQHLYVTAGADDFLNTWSSGRYPGGPKFTIGNDVFFGGGLFFTDDDVKTLLGVGGGSLTAVPR